MKLTTIFQDGFDDGISSKRVVTLLSFLVCIAAFIADTFTEYKVNPVLFESLIYITIAGLGFTASEKFATQRSDQP